MSNNEYQHCTVCECDVALDEQGDFICDYCNPYMNKDFMDDDGVIQEIDFEEA